MPSSETVITVKSLREVFINSADVKFQTYTFRQQKIHFITCESMVDQQLLQEVVVERIHLFYEELQDDSLEAALFTRLHLPGLQQIKKLDDAIPLVYRGNVLLFLEKERLLLASDIAKKPNRNPEETRLEVLVKGPRDNFIEDVSINIALIRKRLPTNSLCVEKMEIGKRSKTSVAIMYFDDIANPETLNEIKGQLSKIDTDIVFSGEILMEHVNKPAKLFPRTEYTGRPDQAVQALVRGRFLIFVDGVAYGVITPVNLSLLLKSGEDNEYSVIFSSFERLLRLSGIGLGLLLPAFWLALTTFHQNQLPLQLLATIVQANSGLPFTSALEMFLMLLMFELFREAGLRLPSAIGGTISVVGGLIIGDAAIRAGVTSPAMIVIIAISTIATFTLVNQSLVTAVSILRVFFIILTAFFGLFGFFIALFFTILYLTDIRIFGVPYINIATNLEWSTIQKTILRLPSTSYYKRPDMLHPIDKTRRQEVEK